MKKFKILIGLGFIFLFLAVFINVLYKLLNFEDLIIRMITISIVSLWIPFVYLGMLLNVIDKNPFSFKEHFKLYLVLNIIILFLGLIPLFYGLIKFQSDIIGGFSDICMSIDIFSLIIINLICQKIAFKIISKNVEIPSFR
ncbi:MAG: hypothetical protein KGD57_09025 [Candidatus Lokiarchaeota archaeon]|nr:hypothetical protein [Candidatus Lokiarchaeota archaeon]